MSKRSNLKQFPVHKTDQEAEHFTDTADLSEYDFAGFKPIRFEFQKKLGTGTRTALKPSKRERKVSGPFDPNHPIKIFDPHSS